MLRLLLAITFTACAPRESATSPTGADPGRQESSLSKPDPRTRDAEYWPSRTDAELDASLEATCAASSASGKPVLLVFSAPWCPDCRRMRDLEAEGPLAEELARWERLTIDPGRFDRHTELLAAFGVAKIATWVATRPGDCRMPAPGWPRLQTGVFEPKSGQPWTSEAIATWLREARGA